MEIVFETDGPERTMEIAEDIAKDLKSGSVITLDGDLGAGKTVFSKGLAKGLGVKEIVDSPTFTVLKIYESGRLPLYHFDVYRIGDADEMYDIGFEEYLYGDGVSLIEWAGLIEDLIPENAIRINIKRNDEKGPLFRRMVITK